MRRVLLIDDEAMVRSTLRAMLEQFGYLVRDAESGRLGLDLLQSAAFDIVITDIVMPEMDGIETLKAIKRRWPDMPVIVMSGGGAPLEAAINSGAAAVLRKPFSMHALRAAIENTGGAAGEAAGR